MEIWASSGWFFFCFFIGVFPFPPPNWKKWELSWDLYAMQTTRCSVFHFKLCHQCASSCYGLQRGRSLETHDFTCLPSHRSSDEWAGQMSEKLPCKSEWSSVGFCMFWELYFPQIISRTQLFYFWHERRMSHSFIFDESLTFKDFLFLNLKMDIHNEIYIYIFLFNIESLLLNISLLELSAKQCKKGVKRKIFACVTAPIAQHHAGATTSKKERRKERKVGQRQQVFPYLHILVCHIYWWWTVSSRRRQASAEDTVPAFCILCVLVKLAGRRTWGSRRRFPGWEPWTGRAGRWPQTPWLRLGSGSRTSPAVGRPSRTAEQRSRRRVTQLRETRKGKERGEERKWLSPWGSSLTNHGAESSCASI